MLKVNTMNVHGKFRRQRTKQAGQAPDWKKAIVTLKDGERSSSPKPNLSFAGEDTGFAPFCCCEGVAATGKGDQMAANMAGYSRRTRSCRPGGLRLCSYSRPR